MAFNTSSNINQLLVERIATKGELKVCDDMIPVRYNGHPGEPMDSMALLSRGPDYRWFGKRRTGGEGPDAWATYGAHPVYIRPGGEAVVPNTPENIAILEGFKPRDHYERFDRADGTGHEMRKVGVLPPLYERIGVNAAGTPTVTAMTDEQLQALATQLMGELQSRRTPAPTPAPQGPGDNAALAAARKEAVEKLQGEATAAEALVAAAQEDFDTAPDEKSRQKAQKPLTAAQEALATVRAKLAELV